LQLWKRAGIADVLESGGVSRLGNGFSRCCWEHLAPLSAAVARRNRQIRPFGFSRWAAAHRYAKTRGGHMPRELGWAGGVMCHAATALIWRVRDSSSTSAFIWDTPSDQQKHPSQSFNTRDSRGSWTDSRRRRSSVAWYRFMHSSSPAGAT